MIHARLGESQYVSATGMERSKAACFTKPGKTQISDRSPLVTSMATEIPDVVVIGESGICLASGDLNGDGLPDLLVPVGTAAVSLLGDGTGGFTQKGSVTLATGGFFTLGDFNHDGKLDLATSGNLLAYGNGDGTFQTPTPFVPNAPPSGFYYIASGDLNGDGWADIVLSNVFDFYVYILINDH